MIAVPAYVDDFIHEGSWQIRNLWGGFRLTRDEIMKPLKFSKKIVANIEKCYAVCPTTIRGEKGFLIATEKAGGCFFFNLEGDLVEQIWSEPGGVMSLVPVPGHEGQFLSTQEFYSPNDSKNARIILATPLEQGWEIKTLAELPFVHRFDILSTSGKNYLIGCTLKSDHNFKEDWTHPGKVYVCQLPEDLNAPDCKLDFKVIMEGLTRNHGYYRSFENGQPYALVSAENGIFIVKPPQGDNPNWQVEKILDQASSDATLIDLDGDGKPELVTLSPFHGDDLNIYRLVAGKYVLDFSYPEKLEFLHAIWSGKINGVPTVLIGHRKGKRDLFILTYDHDLKTYVRQTIDEDHGPANVAVIDTAGKQLIIATNRETDEVALYTLEA